MGFDFEAEAYSKTGNIAADGIQRLLGNPNMDRLETVLRESIQNSWDAAQAGATPECHLEFRELTTDQMGVLRRDLFDAIDEHRVALAPLRESLNSQSMRVLQIADFGTDGLSGPTDPSAVPEEGGSTDFVDFLRNIGTPRDSIFGGGTYGYGKSSLYVASHCRTIIVDSVTEYQGRPERRLMACNISRMYDVATGEGKGRYTGRHWWGSRDEEGVLNPVSNDQASQVARGLGLPERSMEDRGTTILILDPDLPEEYSDDTLGPAVAGALLSNFWPKMVEQEDGEPPMRFSVRIFGRELDLPHPKDAPPLDRFVEALRRARAKQGQQIRSQRPKRLLGHLSCRPGLRSERNPDIIWPPTAPFAEVSHHVALMRPAELVIKYLPGGVLHKASIEWGGVFIVNDEDHEVEQAFALCEPPAHDDWVPSSMDKGPQKTMVTVGLRKIRELINRFGAPPIKPGGQDAGPPLAGIADKLGGSLLSGPGQRLGGAPPGRTGPGGSSTRTGVRRGRLDVEFSGLERRNGDRCARYLVSCGRTDAGYELRGMPEVLLDDRKTVDTAPNGARPGIVGWYDEAGEAIASGDSLRIPPEGGEYAVLVRLPDLVAIRLRMTRDMEALHEH